MAEDANWPALNMNQSTIRTPIIATHPVGPVMVTPLPLRGMAPKLNVGSNRTIASVPQQIRG